LANWKKEFDIFIKKIWTQNDIDPAEKAKWDELYKLLKEDRTKIIPKEINEPDSNVFFDEKGNENPIGDSPADNSKDVVVEVPTGHLGFSGKDSEERQPQHRSIQGSISFGMGINAKMEFTPASENKEPNAFKQKLLSLSFVLPRTVREEFIGDLLEDRAILEKRGIPKWWINSITVGNFLSVLIASRWSWLISSVFKYFKELIQ